MAAPDNTNNTDLKTVRLKLPNGHRALVAVSDSATDNFTAQDWARCLRNPAELTSKPDRVIKSEKHASVLVKTINIAQTQLTVIVKYRHRPLTFGNLIRALMPSTAIRNFRTALKLKRHNIPVVAPIAAIEKKKCRFFTTESIFITRYLPESRDLYRFLRDNTSSLKADNLQLKKLLARQLAQIFADLHNNRLWHRDAKAPNFLVRETAADGLKIILVDLDGIKHYRLASSRSRRFRSLAKLAATVIWHPNIYTTDYLRTLKNYCNLTGLNSNRTGKIFRHIRQQAVAIRLATMANAAIDNSNKNSKR